MKKVAFIFLVLALGIATISSARDSAAKASTIKSFKAGGTPIAIPPPTAKMSEVGYDNRELMNVFVPTTNRLIAAFVLTADLPTLGKEASGRLLSEYAMVEVPRRGEYIDVGADDFKEFAEGLGKQFGAVVNESTGESEEDLNRRMHALDLGSVTMRKPLQLGCFFSKHDAIAFGLIQRYSRDGKSDNLATGVAFLRVKRRILFVYLYAGYRNKDTIKWLRKTTEDWTDAIQRANDTH